MDITYHMVPKKDFESQNVSADYVPAAFAQEGFIHCTDSEYRLSVKAFQYYRTLQDDLLVLFIDKNRVKAKVQYDDPESLYPHIYGPLNRDAIVKTSKMVRDRKGEWIFPVSEILG